MKLYSLGYALILRTLVACYPIIWDETCQRAAWECLRRRMVRGSGRL